MSFASSVGRDLMLTARLSDLTFEINILSEVLLQLQSFSGKLFGLNANLDPGSPAALALQSRESQLALASKGIEIRLENIRGQQRAVQTELESVRKTISDEIGRSFKTFANA